MRLIDADALIDWIRNDSGDKLMDSLYIDHINEMQTAYDVEKVVEKLENLEPFHVDGYGDVMVNIDDVIEIVKQGGASDDVCEWKSTSNGEFIQNPHTSRLFSNEPSMKNVHCNTCGKKIKVVD